MKEIARDLQTGSVKSTRQCLGTYCIAFAVTLVSMTYGATAQNLPKIDRIDPAKGEVGKEILTDIYGTDFAETVQVRIDTFVVSNKFLDRGHIQALLRIPVGTRPGFKNAVLFFALRGIATVGPRPFSTNVNAFEVVPVSVQPDLLVLLKQYSLRGDELVLSALVANVGAGPSLATKLRASALGWATSSLTVLALKVQQTNVYTVTLRVPTEQRGKTSHFVLEIDAQNEAPGKTQNNRFEA